MYKRSLSMLLAVVLVLSLAISASASTNVSDENSFEMSEEQGLEVIEQPIEINSSISPVGTGDENQFDQGDMDAINGFDQSSNQTSSTMSVDENGHAEIVIEIPCPTMDMEELDDGESLSSEEESSTATDSGEDTVDPASTRDDYPLSSFRLLSVKGQVPTSMGGSSITEETVPPYKQIGQFAHDPFKYTTSNRFLNSGEITIALYAEGYGRHTAEPNTYGSYGPGYYFNQSATQGLNVDITGAATAFLYTYRMSKIDPAIPEATLKFIANTYDGKKVWTRELTVRFDGEWREKPEEPIYFSFDKNNPEQYTLNGVDETMEYRRGYNGTWNPCTGNTMFFSTKYAGSEFHVRYQATDELPVSEFVPVIMPKTPAAPTVSINWVDESFKNLTPDMMYTFRDGGPEYASKLMPEGSLKSLLDGISGPEYAPLCIWYPATSEQPASAVQTIKLYPRADEPDDAKLSVDQNTYILTGVTSSMQYIGPGDTAWKAITGTSVNLSNYVKSVDPVMIKVRTKSSTGKSYSNPVEKWLDPPAPIPNLDIDYPKEKIIGFQNGLTYQYKIGTGAWKSLTPKNNEFSIAGLITSKAQDISIRIAGTTDTKMSAPWPYKLPARIAAPACAFVYNDPANVGSAVLTGLEAGMEYQLKGETTWIPSSGQNIVMSLPTANKTYYVRVAATGSSFASTNKTLTLYAPGTAPTSSLNITTENITISKTAEYRIDNGAYTTLPSGVTTLSATEYIDQLSGSETRTITVRFAATETKPASKEKTIKLVARREGPTTMQFDATTQKVTGATTSMQYRVKGTTAWKTVTSKTFSVASLLDGQTNVILEFRYKPANSLVGSKTQDLRCF